MLLLHGLWVGMFNKKYKGCRWSRPDSYSEFSDSSQGISVRAQNGTVPEFFFLLSLKSAKFYQGLEMGKARDGDVDGIIFQ